MDLKELSLFVQKGNAKKTKELVLQALEEKVNPGEILNDGLISAMGEIGVKFKNNEIYVPEMLIAARAMSAGLQILEPILAETGIKPVGKAIIGTVKGDLHDIGKNLVKMMMKGAGIEVIDLGVDVPEVENISAGGMPDRVKCLHSLVAHSLGAGPGVNPLGDEALAALPQWWLENPCSAFGTQE